MALVNKDQRRIGIGIEAFIRIPSLVGRRETDLDKSSKPLKAMFIETCSESPSLLTIGCSTSLYQE